MAITVFIATAIGIIAGSTSDSPLAFALLTVLSAGLTAIVATVRWRPD